MGRPGKKPEPTKLKLIKGTEKRYINENEPRPQPIAPDPPSWLPTEAKKAWKELAPELERLGLLTAIDGPAFTMLVLHWALAVQSYRQMKTDKNRARKEGLPVDKYGLTTIDERKLPRKHPLLQVLRDNSAAFRQYMAEFGLSPSSRSRISLPDPNDEDAFEEFLNRGQKKA
ncbi:MAG: phage terminase small subunit P27 family [Thermoanaerobacteraceae bacterium]|nr:phage terminase small subunit P27 family [Thermoanaerobacteraceae bacterium]